MKVGIYRVLTTAGGPLIWGYLVWRRARGKEDATRFAERLGRAAVPRPDGSLVWLHGASVGESLSMLPVVARLQAGHPDWTVLVTTGTVTSARLMAERLPAGAIHQYVPADRPAWVRRFLDHWRPDLALWFESEFWPNLLCETATRGIPMVLLNGRVSPSAYRRWDRHRDMIGRLLGCFDLCLGQTDEDTRRLADLGARRAGSAGNLKFAAPPLPAEDAPLFDLRRHLEGRPVWLAASTHPGEEAIAGRVHRTLAGRFPGLLTVVAPRHPERGPAIERELAGQGLTVARRSAGALPEAATEVYIADTLGELGLFYRLADVAFMGKSLVGAGGQNPIEPARLGCAVVQGPNVANFADVAARMEAAGAVRTVADEAALSEAVGNLLGDTAARGRLADAAARFAEAEGGVLDRVMAELEPFLNARRDRGRAA